MDAWDGNIIRSNQDSIQDVHLSASSDQLSLKECQLEFVCCVEVSEIPFFMIVGPSYDVWTENTTTQEWFVNLLSQEPESSKSWFDQLEQSYCGILVKVLGSVHNITELVFLAVKDKTRSNSKVLALPISSSVISPTLTESTDSDQLGKNVTTSNLQSSKSSVTTLFDAADQLRRKAVGSGTSIQAAAAALSQARVLVGHKKPKQVDSIEKPLGQSKTVSQLSQLQPRGIRRSPSLSHSRKDSIDNLNDTQRPFISTLEQQNKDMIARLVMAALRMYGLQPPSRSDKDSQHDSEYKQAYYNTYRSVTFTYRRQIAEISLATHTETIQDTIDNLLSIFCNDPLNSLGKAASETKVV